MPAKRAVAVFETIDITQEKFDQPIFWLLTSLLILMPATFGAIDAWSEALAQVGACGLAILLAWKLTSRPDVGFVWSWTYLPIALFFLLGIVQLIPLPAGLVGAISPKTLSTNQFLLGDFPDAAHRLAHIRLSFYQEGTLHDLQNLVAVTSVFVVVINVFRSADQMIRLLWVIAFVGGAEGAIAMLQNLTHAQGIYWLIPLWGDMRVEAGTFPNHNIFAQFMNLSCGAMVGLLLLKLDQTFRRHDYTPSEVVEKLTSHDFRPVWILTAMLVVSVASVFLSLSRGGMLSIAGAGLVVGALLAIRGGARGMGVGGWITGVILVVVFALVMAGGADLVQGRLNKLGNPEARFDRLQLSRDSIAAWKDYRAVGMGLGSFRYSFPSYDRSGISTVASHAEDEYAQLLEETGAVGASIAGLFLLMIFSCFLRARARGKRIQETENPQVASERIDERLPTAHVADESAQIRSREHSGRSRRKRAKPTASPASSLSMGLCFGLVAILVQSATDFGQHFLSVASLTAIFFALLVNLAHLRRVERGAAAQTAVVRGSRILRGMVLAVLVLISIAVAWQGSEVWAATKAYMRQTQLTKQIDAAGNTPNPGEIIDRIRAADEAARIRPNNVYFRFWDNMFKWSAINDVQDPQTGDTILTDAKKKTLVELADDLRDACWAAPTFGPAYAQLGQWERNFLNMPDEGARHIHAAFVLAPNDATVCFILAETDAEQGLLDESVKHFRLAAKLDPSSFGDSLGLLINYFHHPDAAMQLADGDFDRLRLFSSTLRSQGKDATTGPTTGPATQPENEALAKQADVRADRLLRLVADQPGASAQTLGKLGMLCSSRKDTDGAIKYLSQALLRDYGNTEWRLEYAYNLAKVGRNDDAIHQANILLEAHPRWTEPAELIEKLTQPSTRAIQELSTSAVPR